MSHCPTYSHPKLVVPQIAVVIPQSGEDVSNGAHWAYNLTDLYY